jgi:hypothetical protein
LSHTGSFKDAAATSARVLETEVEMAGLNATRAAVVSATPNILADFAILTTKKHILTTKKHLDLALLG